MVKVQRYGRIMWMFSLNLNYIIYTFIFGITIPSILMILLNQQFISDMFANQNSKEHIEVPQEVSLNFTVSSRSTKHNKKEIKDHIPPHQPYQPEQTIDIANNEIANFNQWLSDTQHKFQICHNNLNALMLQIQSNSTFGHVSQDDLLIIKRQVLKKDYQANKECQNCQNCSQKIQQLQEIIKQQNKALDSNEQALHTLTKQINIMSIEGVKQNLIKDVEINLLNNDIKDLNNEIHTLKNQKSLLERTFLFNKTRNSELNLLQKSKSLSAAKNSTNSSELNMIRNHETIIFIDPIESDVDQWIKFFEQQKNRYSNLMKRQQLQKQKEFIRNINRQQKLQENQNKISILHTCLKEIHQNLLRVRENTSNFQMIESTSKYGLRQKFLNNNQTDYTSLKEQNDKLMLRISELKQKEGKLSRINDYLCKEKQNIQEINENLKQQRIKQNNDKYNLYQKLVKKTQERHFFEQKYLEFKEKLLQMQINLQSTEELIKQISNQLKRKEQQLQTNKNKEKYYLQLQKQLKKIQKQLIQSNKEHKVEINCLALKLKKDCLERKKMFNQLEQMKGNVRLYCRIIDNKGLNQNVNHTKDLIVQLQNQNIFNKLFYADNNSQEKVYDDIKKLVCGAFDGNHLTLLSYAQSSTKSYTMHGNAQNPGIIPRVFKEIFKYIEGQKQFMEVQVSLNVLQLQNDKFIGLLANEKLCNYQIKQNQEGNVYLANYPQFMVENYQQLQQIYQDSLSTKKLRQKYKQSNKSHFIMTIILQINNKKTQQNYKSRINLIQLAEFQKTYSSDLSPSKEVNFINKSLSSLFSALNGLNMKQKVNFRQNKLTHYLKDSLSSNNKTILLFTLNASEIMKEQSKNIFVFASKFKLGDRNRRQSDKDEISRQKRSISRKNI